MEVMEDAIDATKVGNIFIPFPFFWSLYSTNTYISRPTPLNSEKSHYIAKEFCPKLYKNQTNPYLLKIKVLLN